MRSSSSVPDMQRDKLAIFSTVNLIIVLQGFCFRLVVTFCDSPFEK